MKLLESLDKQHKQNLMKQYLLQRKHFKHGHKYHYQQDKGIIYIIFMIDICLTIKQELDRKLMTLLILLLRSMAKH